jgi:hypothetical protein
MPRMTALFAADLRHERRSTNGIVLNVRYDAEPSTARPPL